MARLRNRKDFVHMAMTHRPDIIVTYIV